MVQGAGGSGRISAPLTIVGDDDYGPVEKERARGRALRTGVRGVIRGNGAGELLGWGRRRGLADTGSTGGGGVDLSEWHAKSTSSHECLFKIS